VTPLYDRTHSSGAVPTRASGLTITPNTPRGTSHAWTTNVKSKRSSSGKGSPGPSTHTATLTLRRCDQLDLAHLTPQSGPLKQIQQVTRSPQWANHDVTRETRARPTSVSGSNATRRGQGSLEQRWQLAAGVWQPGYSAGRPLVCNEPSGPTVSTSAPTMGAGCPRLLRRAPTALLRLAGTAAHSLRLARARPRHSALGGAPGPALRAPSGACPAKQPTERWLPRRQAPRRRSQRAARAASCAARRAAGGRRAWKAVRRLA